MQHKGPARGIKALAERVLIAVRQRDFLSARRTGFTLLVKPARNQRAPGQRISGS
jgi:hypothetical protein